MVIVYRCGNCGAVLATVVCWEETRVVQIQVGRIAPKKVEKPVKQYKCELRSQFISLRSFPGLLMPSEIAALLGNRCRVCGKPLNTGVDPFKNIVVSLG